MNYLIVVKIIMAITEMQTVKIEVFPYHCSQLGCAVIQWWSGKCPRSLMIKREGPFTLWSLGEEPFTTLLSDMNLTYRYLKRSL